MLRVPAGNIRGPLYMDSVLAAVHQGNPRHLPLTFAFARHEAHVALFCRFPDALQTLVEGQLYAQYPEANLAAVAEDALSAPEGSAAWGAEMTLIPDLFPCRRYQQFEDSLNRQTADPLTSILTAIAGETDSPLGAVIEIEIQPARHSRIHRCKRCIRKLSYPFFRTHYNLAHLYVACALSHRWSARFLGMLLGRLSRPSERPESRALDSSGSRVHEREEDLLAASEKAGRLLFETRIRIRVSGPKDCESDAVQMLKNIGGAFGQFASPRLARFQMSAIRRGKSRRSNTFLLSTEELATIFHPATATVQAPAMAIIESREAEPPVDLPIPSRHPGLAILGVATFRGQEQPCGILHDDRRRHLYLCGKTGQGKSSLLHRLLTTDIAAGRGVGLIDPHGDLCDAVLAAVPSYRTNDVVFFDAGDREFPIAFNILHCPRPELRSLVAEGIIAAFKKLWGEFFGPRMEDIFRNALLTLLEIPGTSLLSLRRLLNDADYRDGAIARVSDPVVRAFWQNEFNAWAPKLRAEAVNPVQNKVGQITTNPLLRNIIGQSRCNLDLRQVLDEGKVLLCNFSKGRMGEVASSLLGSFLTTAIQIAAMSRADVPENQRRDFYLSIDEFENFATSSFATILSEARKYHLNLTIANQYLAQVPEETLSAVWGNVGSLVVFGVGVEDAELLAAQLGGELLPKDLLQCPKFHAYCRLLISGQPTRPFSLKTLAPPAQLDNVRSQMIRRYTRYRYARPASRVEQEIAHAFTAAKCIH